MKSTILFFTILVSALSYAQEKMNIGTIENGKFLHYNPNIAGSIPRVKFNGSIYVVEEASLSKKLKSQMTDPSRDDSVPMGGKVFGTFLGDNSFRLILIEKNLPLSLPPLSKDQSYLLQPVPHITVRDEMVPLVLSQVTNEIIRDAYKKNFENISVNVIGYFALETGYPPSPLIPLKVFKVLKISSNDNEITTDKAVKGDTSKNLQKEFPHSPPTNNLNPPGSSGIKYPHKTSPR